MEQRLRNSYRTAVAAIFCLSVLVHGTPAHSQNTNKRCYTVEETFYRIHDLKTTKEIKPVKHCYSDKDHPYRYSTVDIPVSLTVGAVRTPEFSPLSRWYWIMVQVEKPFPFEQMACMMGVTTGQCPADDPLLRADWKVWSEGQIVSSGSSTTQGDGKYTRDNIFKFLGKFPGLRGKKYALEVSFTKDGTSLSAANPHLIVTKIGDE